MRFSSEWIQQLKQQVSLVDLISENVDLKKTGSRFMGRCPFHGDRTPSFSVNPTFYYCYGCKESGDALSFMTKIQGLSFEEACEELAEKVNFALPENFEGLTSEEERARYEFRKRLKSASRLYHFASLQYYHKNLVKDSSTPLFQEARSYLEKRGISAETIEHFQIGVAGGQPDGLVQFLEKSQAPLTLAREFGLIRISQKASQSNRSDYDFFRERVLFPLIDLKGRVCGFGGRILPSIQADLPKYMNSSESDLFQKSKFLYGLFHATPFIREEESVIIVEGYFDVVSLFQAGMKNVVATCGTSLTEDHLKTVLRLTKKVIVFFDQDQAGISATTKAMELALKQGVLLYGIPYESKLDPDEFILENVTENTAKLKNWMQQSYPLLDRFIENELQATEGNIELRSQSIKKITQWLQDFSDVVGRSLRVDQLIQRWKIPPTALGSLVARAAPLSRAPSYRPSPQHSPQRRRPPIGANDRRLLQHLVHFNEYGSSFEEARTELPEKDTLSVLFEDTEVREWVAGFEKNKKNFSEIKLNPELGVDSSISQELRSVILESLIQEVSSDERSQLPGSLKKGIYKSWARFSQRIKGEMTLADSKQDMEKYKELSQQFLDLQRKLKEFEGSYASGQPNHDSNNQ